MNKKSEYGCYESHYLKHYRNFKNQYGRIETRFCNVCKKTDAKTSEKAIAFIQTKLDELQSYLEAQLNGWPSFKVPILYTYDE